MKWLNGPLTILPLFKERNICTKLFFVFMQSVYEIKLKVKYLLPLKIYEFNSMNSQIKLIRATGLEFMNMIRWIHAYKLTIMNFRVHFLYSFMGVNREREWGWLEAVSLSQGGSV